MKRCMNKDIICLIQTRNEIICENKKMEHEVDNLYREISCFQKKIDDLKSEIRKLRKILKQCYDKDRNYSEEINRNINTEQMLHNKLKTLETVNWRLHSVYKTQEQEIQFYKAEFAASEDYLHNLIGRANSLKSEAGDMAHEINDTEVCIKKLTMNNEKLKTGLVDVTFVLVRKNNELINLSDKVRKSKCGLDLQEAHKRELHKFNAELNSKIILYESLVQAEKSSLEKYLDKIYQAKEKCLELENKLPKKYELYQHELECLRERKKYFLKDIMDKINDAKDDEICKKQQKLETVQQKKAYSFKNTMNDMASRNDDESCENKSLDVKNNDACGNFHDKECLQRRPSNSSKPSSRGRSKHNSRLMKHNTRGFSKRNCFHLNVSQFLLGNKSRNTDFCSKFEEKYINPEHASNNFMVYECRNDTPNLTNDMISMNRSQNDVDELTCETLHPKTCVPSDTDFCCSKFEEKYMNPEQASNNFIVYECRNDTPNLTNDMISMNRSQNDGDELTCETLHPETSVPSENESSMMEESSSTTDSLEGKKFRYKEREKTPSIKKRFWNKIKRLF